jgi:pyruvate kinase
MFFFFLLFFFTLFFFFFFPFTPTAAGPEIRTGRHASGEDIELVAGQTLRLTSDKEWFDKGTAEKIYCDYVALPETVSTSGTGNIIFVDDGLLELRVTAIGDNWVDTRVVNPAKLGQQKGCNLPGVAVKLPAVTAKDKEDLLFGVEQGVDMVFASFIRKPQDVLDVRAVLGEKGANIKIISKIENEEGVSNFDAILQVTDGVMVARGDLGIEIPPAKVSSMQKMMIAKCNLAGKPVICATQMLESMVEKPRPTRAEVSDVANAVLDGSDCVMLSGETAKGSYPVEAVTVMNAIAREAESILDYESFFHRVRNATKRPVETEETIASSAVNAAIEQNAKAILILTNTGRTARLIAKYRPRAPMLAITGKAQTARQLRLTHGVFPVLYELADGERKEVDERLAIGMQYAKDHGFAKAGDDIVCVHADGSTRGFANLVRIKTCL